MIQCGSPYELNSVVFNLYIHSTMRKNILLPKLSALMLGTEVCLQVFFSRCEIF
jgi:hypothetical protein